MSPGTYLIIRLQSGNLHGRGGTSFTKLSERDLLRTYASVVLMHFPSMPYTLGSRARTFPPAPFSNTPRRQPHPSWIARICHTGRAGRRACPASAYRADSFSPQEFRILVDVADDLTSRMEAIAMPIIDAEFGGGILYFYQDGTPAMSQGF